MFRGDISGLNSHPEAKQCAEEAFTELLTMVARTIGHAANPQDALTFALMLWSQAHGLSTLFLDGPLESKLGTNVEAQRQVEAIINLSAHMVALQAAEMGLIPEGQ
jgi:hypothetical protein